MSVKAIGLQGGSPSELLSVAIRERDSQSFDKAEHVLHLGMKRFPDELDPYAHPAFAKELLRTLLVQKKWTEAQALIEQPDFPASEHWHDLLFARAYNSVGDKDSAARWFSSARINYPSAWHEIDEWVARSGAVIAPEQQLKTPEAMKVDLGTARQLVRYGAQKQNTSFTVSRFLANSASASRDRAVETLLSLIATSERKYSAMSELGQGNIPQICHRIWLTNPSSPVEPPRPQVERFLKNCKEAFSRNWRHVLWVQDAELIPETMKLIAQSGVPVEIKSISSDLVQDVPMEVAQRLIHERKYAFAADILRLKCLYQYGGLYVDIGIYFNVPVDELVLDFDYLFLLWQNFFFQNSLLAMPRHAALANLCLNVIAKPEYFPRYLLDEKLYGNSDLSLFSGPALTVLFFLAFPISTKAGILVSNRQCISHTAQGSWFKPTSDKMTSHLGGAITKQTDAILANELVWSGVERVFFGAISD